MTIDETVVWLLMIGVSFLFVVRSHDWRVRCIFACVFTVAYLFMAVAVLAYIFTH